MAKYNAELAERIITLANNDMAAIEQANAFARTHPHESSKEIVTSIERKDTEGLRAILQELGEWPSESMVGNQGAVAAFVIAQHSDHDIPFQKHCLALMHQAVAHGDMPPESVAFLIDRIRVNEGRPQLFATQLAASTSGELVAKPTAIPDQVEVRRKDVGVDETLSDYITRMRNGDKTPFREMLHARAQSPQQSHLSASAKSAITTWESYVSARPTPSGHGIAS